MPDVLSYATVRTHIQNILAKLLVRGRIEAVSLAFQQHLIPVPTKSDAPTSSRLQRLQD